MTLFVNDGIAVVVTFDFVFRAAALCHLCRGGAIDVGKDVAVTVFDDLHKGFVGLDELEFIAAFGVNAYAYAGIERNSFFVVGNNNLFGGVETESFAQYFFFCG